MPESGVRPADLLEPLRTTGLVVVESLLRGVQLHTGVQLLTGVQLQTVQHALRELLADAAGSTPWLRGGAPASRVARGPLT